MKLTYKLVLKIVITTIIFLAIIFITMSFMSAITKKPFSILGTSYGVVQTPSMEPKIVVGDFVIMHQTNYDALEVGDVIAFESSDGSRVIIHEIIEIEDEGYITKGLNNMDSDFDTEGYITEDKYLAKVVWFGGSFIGKFLVNQRLLVIGIIIIFIFLIFIIQAFILIHQLLERQKYKYKTDLEKYKEEFKNNKKHSAD